MTFKENKETTTSKTGINHYCLEQNNYLVCENRDEIVKININEIYQVIQNDYLTTIHYGKRGNKFTFTTTLSKIENKLDKYDLFFRINRNIIVSLKSIKSYNKKSNTLYLDNRITHKVAVRRAKELCRLLSPEITLASKNITLTK
ncbi:MAG: LytTR family transcriptional regulator DNA-binding domain-containing protein [Bacteroidales bacterium]|nr:LytTR family transcriptional regulator DNA-binding domain-containing protein [Bacteroidales bacterium]